MNEASLYSKYSGLQKTDAKFVVDNYLRLVKWKSHEKILDVGSGDGDVLLEILLPGLPPDFHRLVGTDVSDDMVRHARNKCKHSKVDFVPLDIATSSIPPEFYEYFDHIFSFYCLHWVPEQRWVSTPHIILFQKRGSRRAMKNMFDMLTPGGDMLLAFLASNPIYDIYENMAKSNKWAPYMHNVKKYISPYHHSEHPENELEDILKKEGFVSHLCRVEDRTYTFPSFQILSSTSPITPFPV